MIRRSSEDVAQDAGFDRLRIGWLTWVGFAVSMLGWALLLGGTALTDLVLVKIQKPVTPGFHADMIEIARGLIETGLGLAIVGALQSGFGTLNRFFGAVLTRSTRRDPAPLEPVVERPPPAAAKQGATGRRPYRLFADGSVEVETIVGTRTFRTMAEAREFI